MAITVSFTDNANGTGLVATVAGSAVGSTNQLYYARHYGGMLSAAWALGGSRTGDGTIPVSLSDMGPYWLYLVNTNGVTVTVTQVRAFQVTDAATTDAVYFRILEAVVARLQSLSLTDIPSVDIRWQKMPWNGKNEIAQGIIVSPLKEMGVGGSNMTDDNAYQVQITFLRKNEQDLTDSLSKELLWRQIAQNAFDVTPYADAPTILLGVPEAFEIDCDPSVVIDPVLFQAGWDVQALVLRVTCRETRGL
jgi:hypothetical protein